MERATGTISARVVQVIETRAKKGLGTKSDPAREIVQYWDLEGNHLATFDKFLIYHIAKLEEELSKKAISECQELGWAYSKIEPAIKAERETT